jgi:1-acyl-sn-glycerol-3-phosphate acyltransferase
MRLRAARRAVTLCATLFLCILRYWLIRIRGPLTLQQRALWMQSAGRQVVSSLGIRCTVEGTPPESGLVVSNHLSYLDIVILSAAMPCFFVAKAEIDRWPYFGRAARSGGTLFIDRSSMASAGQVAAEIAQRLPLSVPILFFPEGTSTDGSAMLRFHTRLFEPAIHAGAPVTGAAIRYTFADGSPERNLCWYGDAPFLPHLWKTLGTAGFTAEVRFGEPHTYAHRRSAAAETYAEIAAMRGAAQPAPAHI